jgi:hypothetical protein
MGQFFWGSETPCAFPPPRPSCFQLFFFLFTKNCDKEGPFYKILQIPERLILHSCVGLYVRNRSWVKQNKIGLKNKSRAVKWTSKTVAQKTSGFFCSFQKMHNVKTRFGATFT